MYGVRTWIEGCLPTELTARFRAKLLLVVLGGNTLLGMFLLFGTLFFAPTPEALVEMVISQLVSWALLIACLRWQQWRLIGVLVVLFFGVVGMLAHCLDPGPQASVVALSMVAVFMALFLTGPWGAAAVGVLHSGAIFYDGLQPHLHGLSEGHANLDLGIASVTPVFFAIMLSVLDRTRETFLIELETARQRAEAGARAKSDFLATMSHEIRTPLNGVLGLTQVLQRSALDEEQARLVRTIHHSGEALRQVLNDVLDYSRLDAGRLALEQRSFSPKQLVDEVIALFAPSIADRSLILGVITEASVPPFIWGDPFRLRQVVTNLVSNAVKFTSAGVIDVSLSWPSDAELVLSVQDSGIGIAQERLAELFDPFVQAEDSTTRRFGGTGLGLAISHRLVQAMGGEIAVDSVLGEGTCFTIRLPATVAEAVSVEAVPKRHQALSGRVLVAEDNPINQLVIRKMLQLWGVTPDVVGNGREAVDAVCQEVYDVVLMDLFMPEMNGRDATRAIRALPGPRAASVPIFILTASVEQVEQRACMDAGANKILGKPLQEDQLYSALSTVLDPAPKIRAVTG
ncbi:MAG: ATP-binding protein [Myxococcota bacterium]